ncbi:MAG TPA: tetratricopeptide repeat protein [Acidobacteriota bacterium]|nr:tetratricopeptide repeat protein [Acidobacteriota bacterium]
MKISSVIKLVILFALFYYVIMFINANQGAQKINFPWFGGDAAASTPMWGVMGVCLAIGFIASALWMLGKTIVSYFSPTGKLSRSMKQVEEKYYYGIEALSKGDHQSASVFFEEILVIDPDNFRTLIKFGELLRETGQHQRAISIHLQALNLSRNNVKVLHELAKDYKESGNAAKAKEMLKRIIDISPKGNNAIYRQLRDVLLAEGSWEEALEVHRKLIPLVSHNGRRIEEMALLSGLEYEVATARLNGGDTNAAIQMFKSIIQRDTAFLPAHVDLGEALLQAGKNDEAVETWLKGYEAITSPVLLVRLEDYYLDNDNPEKAIEIYHKVIAKEEENLMPKLLLGKLFYHLSMMDRAMAIFEEIDSEFEHAPVMQYFMGKIQSRKGEHENAFETLRTLVRGSGLLQTEFICTSCCTTYDAYHPRCSKCGSWNTIRLNVQKGQSLSDMEVASRPVYA